MWCACRRRAPTTSSWPRALAPALSDGWHLASAGGDVKGRNGVAVLSRHPIKSVRDLGADEFALHGRYLEVDTAGLTVVSLYIQTGEAGTDRQLEKERFMAVLAHRMATQTGRDAVVCGDWRNCPRDHGGTQKPGRGVHQPSDPDELLEYGYVVLRRSRIRSTYGLSNLVESGGKPSISGKDRSPPAACCHA